MPSYKTLFKDFKNKPELEELLPIIEDLNKLLANIIVYRSHKHRETYFHGEGVSVEKKWLKLEFAICTKSISRSRPLPAEIKIEIDPEKCKQHLEEFGRKYEKWLLDYECRRAEKKG